MPKKKAPEKKKAKKKVIGKKMPKKAIWKSKKKQTKKTKKKNKQVKTQESNETSRQWQQETQEPMEKAQVTMERGLHTQLDPTFPEGGPTSSLTLPRDLGWGVQPPGWPYPGTFMVSFDLKRWTQKTPPGLTSFYYERMKPSNGTFMVNLFSKGDQ